MAVISKRMKDEGLVRKLVPVGIPLTLVAFAGIMATRPELRIAVPLLVGGTAAMAMLLAWSLYLGERGLVSWSPPVILLVSLLLRLMFLFSPPQLSDDLYRYLWDGSRLLAGENPYVAAPARVKPSPELAGIHSLINHPQYVTIYPPAAQLVFAGGAAMGGVTGLKTLLVLFDLGLCALLIFLLQRLQLPVWRAVLYAWNPLAVIEIAGSGHVDGAGLALLAGSIFLLLPERHGSALTPGKWPCLFSGALLASAGLVKLFPFLLLPVLFLLVPKGRRLHFAGGFVASLAALVLAFSPQLVNMVSTLDSYGRNWEFAGFAFNLLRTVIGSGTTSRLILAACFLLFLFWTVLRLSSSLKQESSPLKRGRPALEACYGVALALLLLTPTLQPWYALCLALFLPFCPGPAGIVLCWSVFLTYQVQIPYFISGKWIENPNVTAAVFLAPAVAYILSRIVRRYSVGER